MRTTRPQEGKTRTEKRFLIFPLTISGETRWLEMAKWEEKVVYYVNVFSKEYRGWEWKPQRWLDD